MTTRRFMAAGLATAIVVALATSASAGWWDKAADATPVDLTKVLDNPHAYQGKEITFDVVYHQVSTFYNPYYTRFVPSEYVNFSAWPVARKLWNQGDYAASHTFFFLEKDHAFYQQLMGLERFTRLRLTGFVQNTFKGVPWIEVRHVERLEGALDRRALREVILGDEAAAAGRHAKASEHFANALATELPADVLASVTAKHGSALLALGRRADAEAALAQALTSDPNCAEAMDLEARLNPKSRAGREALADAKSSGVDAKAIDPARYAVEPKAMPVPAETAPAPEVAPVPETAPAVEPVKVEVIEAGGSEVETPAAPPAGSTGTAEPGPGAVEPESGVTPASTGDAPPEAPAEAPAETPEEAPAEDEEVPEKKISGPM